MGLTFQNIRFVPIVHRRVTFAEQVRLAVREWQPEILAVELPVTLQRWIEEGVQRLPRISAVCWEEEASPGAMRYVPIDPCDGLIEAVRLGQELSLPVAYIDLDLPNVQEAYVAAPDDLIVDKTGLDRYVEASAPAVSTDPGDAPSLAREAHMARGLRKLAESGRRILCVLGLGHYWRVRPWVEVGVRGLPPEAAALEGLRERDGVRLTHVAPESLMQALGEMPFVAWRYQQLRASLEGVTPDGSTEGIAFDKLGTIQDLMKEAETAYEKTYRERINMTQWRGMLQYMRNLAMVGGRLRPSTYELVTAANGMVDGDYGRVVYERAQEYPPQAESDPELPLLRIKGVRGLLEGSEQKFRMEPRWETTPTERVRLRFRLRPPQRLREQWKSMWEREFRGGNICSWPPEDDLQERFMNHVRKRALQAVTDDRKQTQEFSTSLLDGLDIRETMRHWHQGKLMVQQTPQARGRVGAVVIVFEDEPIRLEGSWRATLYAEHRNESDISFFATPLGRDVVGPRISRTQFGGILSIWPAWGIPDIWAFEPSSKVRLASEALLGAAILFSLDRYVAFVSAKPPRAALKLLATVNRKQIVHMPLATFSHSQLRRVRQFHVLNGRDVRNWARDYIFEE